MIRRSPFMLEQIDVVNRLYASKPPHMPADINGALTSVLDGRDILAREDLHIAVFGVFKTGKSTLLNALIGKDLLPTNVIHDTGVLTELRYGDGKVFVTKATETGDQVFPVSMEEVKRYIRISSAESKDVKLVTIQLPLPLLQSGIVLIDSPGLEDDGILTEKARHALRTSDLALMVISVQHGLGAKERKVISEIHELLHGNIVFVGNRIDLIPQEALPSKKRNIESILASRGNEVVGKPRIFYVSAQHILEEIVASRQVDFPLQAWLHELFGGPDGERLALASRLSIILERATQAIDELTDLRDRAVANAEQLEREARDSGGTQAKKLASKVQKAHILLNDHRANFGTNYASFVSDAIARVEARMKKDDKWSSRSELDPLIRNAFAELWNQIDDNVAASTRHLSGFNLDAQVDALNPDINYAIATDSAEDIGLIVGGILGFIFSGGFAALVGAGAGGAVAKWLFGKDVKKESLAAIRSALENNEESCRAMANNIYDRAEAAINKYEKVNAPQTKLPVEVKSLRRQAADCADWIRWLEGLQSTVQDLYTIIQM